MHNLWINGVSLKELGVYVSGEAAYNSAEQEIEFVQVPGRSGDLIRKQVIPRYSNIVVKYPAYIRENFAETAAAARNQLQTADYADITDDYNPGELRRGILVGGLSFNPVAYNSAANTEIVFNCQPQRWLPGGKDFRPVPETGIFDNIGQPASPILQVSGTGSGRVTVGANRPDGGQKIDINFGSYSFITLDCENELARHNAEFVGSQIEVIGGQWPFLTPGENFITFTGGITKIDIAPRWWKL